MKYQIGDILQDEDGNMGLVVVKWIDGDICVLENDAAHPGPIIISNILKDQKELPPKFRRMVNDKFWESVK